MPVDGQWDGRTGVVFWPVDHGIVWGNKYWVFVFSGETEKNVVVNYNGQYCTKNGVLRYDKRGVFSEETQKSKLFDDWIVKFYHI